MIKHPLQEELKDWHIVLGSGSPRRKRFFEEMGLDFEVRLQPVEETYPPTLQGSQISDYLATLKANALKRELGSKEILITADTVVWWQGESLEKAADTQEATVMLEKLSGDWHQVISSVCFTTTKIQKTINATTRVKFKTLSPEEIAYYIQNFSPYDKAGAYGIQEWLGSIAIEQIQGSYNTVVGLPTHLVYKTLMDIAMP